MSVWVGRGGNGGQGINALAHGHVQVYKLQILHTSLHEGNSRRGGHATHMLVFGRSTTYTNPKASRHTRWRVFRLGVGRGVGPGGSFVPVLYVSSDVSKLPITIIIIAILIIHLTRLYISVVSDLKLKGNDLL